MTAGLLTGKLATRQRPSKPFRRPSMSARSTPSRSSRYRRAALNLNSQQGQPLTR